MVRIRSSTKHRKVQTKVKNKKKKRNSVSRGTETDFDQVCDTTAVNLNDSFGIWMGGKTSTPEKKDSSPSSAWYPHRRIDNNDHSAHSIVFFEETLDSSKTETKLDSPDTPTLGPITNICKTSNEETEHDSMQDKSPMQHLWEPDTLSQMGSVKDESGTLVFESSGKVFFRHGEEKETSKVVEGSLRESSDKRNLDPGSSFFSESQSFVLMEENFNLSNKNHWNISEQSDSGELGKCCQPFLKEEKDSTLLTVRDNTNKAKSTIKSPPYSIQSENLKERSFPNSYLTDDIHYVTQSTNVSDELDHQGILHGLNEENKENRSPLCQIPNKSRSRRCIALKGYDVMTNFDDALNDVKDKVETFCHSEVHVPGSDNKLLNRSSPAKFGSVLKCPSKQKPSCLSPKMTLLNSTGFDEDSSKALSDITNNANFFRARYRAPADNKIREPSMVTFRTIPTQRKWASIPDKHIYSNFPSMMFPCLTYSSDTYDVSNQSKESSHHPNFSKCHVSQEKENCITRRNPSAFVPHVPDHLQGVGDHMKDQLSKSSIDNSSSEDSDREIGNSGAAVNAPFPINQTANVLLARNHARPHSHKSSDDTDLARGTAFGQQPERHRYNSNKLSEPSQTKSHGFPFSTTSNFSISSQGSLPQKGDGNDKNPNSRQLSNTQEVRHDSPVSDPFQMPYETDYVERKVEKLNVQNRQLEFSLEVGESSKKCLTNKNIQSQGVVHDKYLRQNERLTKDQKLVKGKERMVSKVPKLLDFYENHSAKTPTGKPKSRRSCMPIISTMTVSNRVNMFEQNTESNRNTDEGTVGREVFRHESIKLKTSSSKHKNRLSLPALDTGQLSRDKFNNVEKSYETGLGSNHFETISKQHTSRRHHEKSPNREAIVLFEFSYYVTRKREAILFQRGEVVQVLSKWIDGQVRIRKCLDKTEAILPRKCLFFISGDASITKQAGHFLYGSNYSNEASTDPLPGQSAVKANHLNETTLLEPFLVVRPYIAESTNEVTVLRGEVIIMNAKLAQGDQSEWSWVYVPRTQGFGFVPSSVARPLTFEPVTE